LQSYGEAMFRRIDRWSELAKQWRVKNILPLGLGADTKGHRLLSSAEMQEPYCLRCTAFCSCSFYTLQQQSALCCEYASHALVDPAIKKRV
jgi:hypothetical protein